MNKEQLEAFAREAAKTIKTESDLNDFRQMLTKVTVETTLNAELDDHLGYNKHRPYRPQPIPFCLITSITRPDVLILHPHQSVGIQS